MGNCIAIDKVVKLTEPWLRHHVRFAQLDGSSDSWCDREEYHWLRTQTDGAVETGCGAILQCTLRYEPMWYSTNVLKNMAIFRPLEGLCIALFRIALPWLPTDTKKMFRA